ncbi:hypothetical protein R1sor_015487 [Riccia sorocarpa]|uniref:Bifunctional inhibitor/plant lipid transfer protein/seed storage helical domain-containing protein n=1 Tax=Riccia sorocarpa TaxID=122646 RepID=A0ABD3HCD4_9MARC
MGSNRAAMVVVILLIGLLGVAEVSEAAAKKNCGKDLLTPFRPCISSVIGKKPSAPTAACCSAVKKTDLGCLCKAFTSLKLPGGIKIDIKAAITLPKKCGRNVPVNYKCNGQGVRWSESGKISDTTVLADGLVLLANTYAGIKV